MNYILSFYIIYCVFNTTRHLLDKLFFKILRGVKK